TLPDFWFQASCVPDFWSKNRHFAEILVACWAGPLLGAHRAGARVADGGDAFKLGKLRPACPRNHEGAGDAFKLRGWPVFSASCIKLKASPRARLSPEVCDRRLPNSKASPADGRSRFCGRSWA